MKKFEYKEICFDNSATNSVKFDVQLKLKNELGSEGWELIHINSGLDTSTFYYKREIEENNDPTNDLIQFLQEG